MVDIKRQLNPSQFAAVTTIHGPVLVIAGAGSGKTRVIEYRVLHLVQNKISPNSILLLTFTRRAAREMLTRAAKHDPRCKNVEGGTFHSFAYKVLKKYAKAMGFPDSFSVLDEGDAGEAIHRSCTKLGFFDKEKRFPRKDTLKNILSMSVNKNISVSEVLKKEYPHFLEYAPDIENLRKAYAEYKIKKNYMDYDDLLIYLTLLLENQDIRLRLSQKYKFIMVDEYQDTNKLQGDITYLLAESHKNVMVVGDDAQSIYGFRGASHENIMEFPEKFLECKIIKLEENYRSTQSILDVANAVLENMKNKYSKCLVSARKQIGEKPHLLFFKDAYEEAEWGAEHIKKQRDAGIVLGHQCVLFRSSYLSIPLQAELSKRNIPYEVFGGLKFYETAHVKDVMAHLKVIANPKDELAWNRVLMLIEGIGPRTAERILEEIITSVSLSEILDTVFHKYDKGLRYSEGLTKLSSALREACDEKTDVGEKFGIVLEYYNTILIDKFDDWHLRLNDLEALRQISTRYDSLKELLEDFAIEPPERGVWRVEPETKEEEKPLTLSTIHSAKGLEWECVFLISLTDGVLPVSFALDHEDEIEEEQRLFYVAITRARKHLFLSLHHEGTRGGITQFNKVSRFLDTPNVLSKLDLRGIPQSSIKKIVPYEEAEKVTQVYDKKLLVQRVIDFLNSIFPVVLLQGVRSTLPLDGGGRGWGCLNDSFHTLPFIPSHQGRGDIGYPAVLPQGYSLNNHENDFKRRIMMQVLILYYSKGGNTKKLAAEVAKGVESAGVKAALKSTKEVTKKDFLISEGIIAGSPVYFGVMAADLKRVFDEFVGTRSKMENKVGAAFATAGHHTGGKETTIMSILQCMLIYGMIIVGDPMSASGHYGVACVGAPDEKTAADAFKLGARVAELCKKLK